MFKSQHNIVIPSLLACFMTTSCGLFRGRDLHGTATMGKEPQADDTMSKLIAYFRVRTHPAHQAARDRIFAHIKGEGSVSRVQELLASSYHTAQKRERLAILYILNLYTLKEAGCADLLKALPDIAQDFTEAWSNHPNEMSFQGFYVLEEFLHFAWRKLPAHSDRSQEESVLSELMAGDRTPQAQSHRSSADGVVHVGSPEDRKAIVKIIVEKQLHRKRPHNEDYVLPRADETDWIRIIGNHAFVRLHGQSSGTDSIFVSSVGRWSLLTSMGAWIH